MADVQVGSASPGLPSWLGGPDYHPEPSPGTLLGMGGDPQSLDKVAGLQNPNLLGTSDYVQPKKEGQTLYRGGEIGPQQTLPFGDPPVTVDEVGRLDQVMRAKLSGELGEFIQGQTTADRNIEDIRDKQIKEMTRARDAMSYDLASVPPKWDADAEQKARMSGPFESFGSIGSIFGIMASMFTKQPMTSALNASAAAMNAIKQRDTEGYRNAYQAWKDNTELAIKRFDLEKQIAEETNKLFDTDVNKWAEKKAGDAARFNNKWKQVYIDNGLWGELLDVEHQSYGVKDMMQKQKDAVDKWHRDFELYQEIGKGLDVADQAMLQVALAKDDKPAIEFLNRVSRYYSDNEGVRMPGEERNKQWAETHAPASTTKILSGTTSGATTGAGFRVELAKEKIAAENARREAEGRPPLTVDEKEKIERESRKTPLSEAAEAKIEEKIDAYTESMRKIDASLSKLNKYIGVAGAAGYATRLEERLGNIIGHSYTDRQQFARDIEYIRAQAKKLLLDESAGRNLKEDAQRIDTIVGGISMGDTGKSAMRSLQEVKEIYERLQRNEKARLGGTWTPETDTAPTPKPKSSGARAWERAGVVGQ
jgi:hypothetical protein